MIRVLAILLALTVGTGLTVQLASPVPVRGQVDTFQAQEEIFVLRRYGKEITDLRTLYRDQMELYRNSERSFITARGQFDNLENLSSLEDLVQATNDVYQIRVKVLITYLDLMYAALTESDGVELSLKQHSLKEIESVREDLAAHLAEIEQATDRQQHNQLATEFAPLFLQVDGAAHFAMSLLLLSDVQQVFDKAVLLQAEVEQKAADMELSQLEQAEFDRAVTEIDRAVNGTRTELLSLTNRLNGSKGDYSRSNYRSFQPDVGSAYNQVARIVSYVEELNTSLEESK